MDGVGTPKMFGLRCCSVWCRILRRWRSDGILHNTQKYTEKILSNAPNHETPFDVRRAFTRLRSVSIPEWDCDDTPINACDIMNSFGFPSLQQFSGYGVADFADNDEVSRITKLGAFSNVNDISFYGSNSTNGLASFVLVCEKLQSFVYENIVSGEWGEPWNPPAIFNTLLHHKDTLVKIHVYNADVHERCDPSEDDFFRLTVKLHCSERPANSCH